MRKNYSFDEYVSLGNNCEVSYRIKDFLYQNFNSFPFAWADIHDNHKFLDALNNLDDILKHGVEFLNSGMVLDKKYEIAYHLKIDKSPENIVKFLKNEKLKTQALSELRSRMNHLIDKFNQLLQSKKSTLFIIKFNPNDDVDIYVEIFNFLEKNYHSGRFELLIVFEFQINESFVLYFSKNKKIALASVSKFARRDETKTGGDVDGWLKAIASAGGTRPKAKANIFKQSINFIKEHGLKNFIRHIFKKNKK